MGLQVNALHAHELDYELSIRDISPTGSMDNKRKVLRGLLSQEAANRSFNDIANPYDFVIDHKEILDSLENISKKIDSFSGNKEDSGYKLLSTRLWHLSGRINRLNTTSDEQRNIKKKVLIKLLNLESNLDEKVTPITSTPTNVSHHISSAFPNFNSNHNIAVPVYKWGIQKFTGQGSVMAFLEKIETLRIARNCSTNELFSSASELFDSQAWTWWHNNHIKNRFCDWNDLVNKLKGTFLRDNVRSKEV